MKKTNSISKSPGAFKRFLKENGSAYLMVMPSLIMFCLLTLYPLLWVIINMFYDTDGVTYKIFIGLDNFKRVLGDSMWWNSVLNTLEFALKLLVFQVPIAIVLAAVLNKKVPGRGFFRGAYYMPAITSAAVMSLVFSFMFSPYNGVINQICAKFGIGEINWFENPKMAMWMCVMFSLWASFGHNMLLVLSGLQGIPLDVYESASLDGASEIRQFFSITLPMLLPVLRTVVMLSLIGALQGMDSILVLTNGGPNHATEVMPLYIYNQFFAGSTMPQYGYGAACGVTASFVIGIITVIYNLFSKKAEEVM